MSTMLPGTSPPPSTRLSSPLGNLMRGMSSALTCEIFTGATLRRPSSVVTDTAARLFLGATGSSIIVFHSPQAGQRPTHFDDSLPQFLQKYVVACFI